MDTTSSSGNRRICRRFVSNPSGINKDFTQCLNNDTMLPFCGHESGKRIGPPVMTTWLIRLASLLLPQEGMRQMFGWKEKRATGAFPSRTQSTDVGGFLITGQSGLLTGTHVASNLGWRPVEALTVGDQVLTFDHGMQTVLDIQRERFLTPEMAMNSLQRPIHVPSEALQNRRDLWLMPEQGLLVESDEAEDAVGDPYAVISANMLIGFRGISSGVPSETIEVTTLAFAKDEVVYVEGGMLAYCPHPRQLLFDGSMQRAPLYNVMNGAAARYVVDRLIELDDASALSSAPDLMPFFFEKKERPKRPQFA